MTTHVIGIDPGLYGAVALLGPPAHPLVLDMPTMKAGTERYAVQTQVNPAALADMLRRLTDGIRDETIVVMERVDGYIDNKAACFSMGNSFGCVRGVVATLGLPLHIVRAQDWKKHYSLKRDKELSRRRAIELYPMAPLDKIKHHNRAEAILIARYGWEELR